MPPSNEKAENYGVRASMIGVQPSGKQLREINQLTAAGKLKTHIATVLPLSKVRKAQELPRVDARAAKSSCSQVSLLQVEDVRDISPSA